MNAVSSLETFNLEYEYSESVEDYKELQKLVKRLRRKKNGL